MCKNCSIEMICYGGDRVAPRKGFWRYNEKSTNFIKC